MNNSGFKDFYQPAYPYRESPVFFYEIRDVFQAEVDPLGIEVVQTKYLFFWKKNKELQSLFRFSDVIGNKRTIRQSSPMRFSTLVFFTLRTGREKKGPSSKPYCLVHLNSPYLSYDRLLLRLQTNKRGFFFFLSVSLLSLLFLTF